MARDTWATRIGFILAAMGSAVGLGNIWRFPWLTAANGGGAFLVVYLFVIFVVGVPGLLAALVIGRRAKRNPIGAFRKLSNGSRAWPFLGVLFLLTTVVLLSFYSVVGGWTLNYFVASFTGAYGGDPGAYYEAINFGTTALLYQALFLILTAIIVGLGVRRGIEMGTKVMMPALIILLVAISIWAAIQPGAAEGYVYYFTFDLSTVIANIPSILPAAVGQAAFTLSVGNGAMITYASYIGEDHSLPFDGSAIAILNTLIGVLAGLVVFPLLFVFTGGPGSGGPGTVFVSLAAGFAALPYGRLLGAAFYAVIVLAALSSSISMLEIPVSYLVDEYDVERRTVTFGLLVLVLITGATNSLNGELFTFVSGPLVSMLMTAGFIGILLFAGWVLKGEAIAEFTLGAGPIADAVTKLWFALVSVALPLFLGYSLLQLVFDIIGVSVSLTVTVLTTLILGILCFGFLYRQYPNTTLNSTSTPEKPNND